MYKYLKPLSFVPAIIMLCLIFSFSAQNGEDSGNLSYKISYKIVETKSKILSEKKSPEALGKEADAIHLYVRKAGHMGEYFILALTFLFPFYVYGIRGMKLFLTAFLCAVAAAASDEYHQSFVDGRGPSVMDVFIDSSGAFSGLLFSKIIFIIRRMILKRKKGR